MDYSQIKKHEEYKQLCIASYKPFDEGKICNYNLVAAVPGKNGFFACVYKKGNEMVIVYRGTDKHDKGDLENDKQMMKSRLPEQTKNALEVYEKFSKISKENGMRLTVIGHSLGGSLAAIVGAMRGVETVTFNAYGVKQLLNPNIRYFTNNIVNYCNKYDPVTKIKAKYHMGQTYTVQSEDIFKNPHILENMGSLYEREEAYAPYLQDQYEREECSKKEFEEYKKYGRRFIHMPGLYSENNESGCSGSYPVSSYTREDGTKVDSYVRTCYKHGS